MTIQRFILGVLFKIMLIMINTLTLVRVLQITSMYLSLGWGDNAIRYGTARVGKSQSACTEYQGNIP